jgi:glycosyltransferase involved in cell wall biosynthesis
MQRLRVALCITDLEVGGAERCLVELAVRLDRRRFEPVVYCLGPPPEEPVSCLGALEAAGIEVHCLGARRKRQIVGVVRRLRRLWIGQRPEIVQSFLFHANLVARLAARRAGVSWVLSGIRVAERRRRWPLWADRLTERLVDRHVCVSESVARFSETQGRLTPEKLVVIPNGIDVDRYPARRAADPGQYPAPLGIAPGRDVVSYVGRLEAQQKGLRWLLETAPAWLGRLGNCDLLLVGKGPERAALERLAAAAGVADRVHFAGWRDDVPEILARSRLLVLPSAWEGMPNVVLEAMAARLPVVASDVEGVRELLGPGAEAQTVHHGDSESWVEKVVGFISDVELAEKTGLENRRRVEEHFTLAGMVAAYEGLWESLAK